MYFQCISKVKGWTCNELALDLVGMDGELYVLQ